MKNSTFDDLTLFGIINLVRFYFYFFVIERCNLLFLGYLLSFNLPCFLLLQLVISCFPEWLSTTPREQASFCCIWVGGESKNDNRARVFKVDERQESHPKMLCGCIFFVVYRGDCQLINWYHCLLDGFLSVWLVYISGKWQLKKYAPLLISRPASMHFISSPVILHSCTLELLLKEKRQTHCHYFIGCFFFR